MYFEPVDRFWCNLWYIISVRFFYVNTFLDLPCQVFKRGGKVFSVSKHYAIEGVWEMKVKLQSFLTSALDGVEWSASHFGCLIPGTSWIGLAEYSHERKNILNESYEVVPLLN
jgi:hypothetical protein